MGEFLLGVKNLLVSRLSSEAGRDLPAPGMRKPLAQQGCGRRAEECLPAVFPPSTLAKESFTWGHGDTARSPEAQVTTATCSFLRLFKGWRAEFEWGNGRGSTNAPHRVPGTGPKTLNSKWQVAPHRRHQRLPKRPTHAF